MGTGADGAAHVKEDNGADQGYGDDDPDGDDEGPNPSAGADGPPSGSVVRGGWSPLGHRRSSRFVKCWDLTLSIQSVADKAKRPANDQQRV